MFVEELAHEKMVTAENVEDFYEILGVGAECALELSAGDVVSVFRSAGGVFTLFHGDKRCCWPQTEILCGETGKQTVVGSTCCTWMSPRKASGGCGTST